ncbi:hypothetical protein LTR84_004877 [Exophiala bonariae]|uniref:F-box domain-containing protein n=1 Tax=Exophiala bonariae TaxID=1690606 RepID=A0AAV9NS19_9EURO|nr:hypothetical protein LTR84_004877 [Exophiala bonariae]
MSPSISSPPSPSPSPSTSQPTRTSLLTIPIELRTLIYNNLLSGPNRYIISTSDRHRLYQRLAAGENRPRSQGAYAFPAANLLVVNRQLRVEIQPLIIERASLYCSLTDFYERSYCTLQLPIWLRTSLKQFAIYEHYATSSASSAGVVADLRGMDARNSDGGEQREPMLATQLANQMEMTSRRVAYVRRGMFLKALPALESVEVLYLWRDMSEMPEATLEDFHDGELRHKLMAFIRHAFRTELLFDYFVAERLVSGQLDGLDPGDIPEGLLDANGKLHPLDLTSKELPVNRVKVSITTHLCEMYPEEGAESRCLCISYSPPSYNTTQLWMGPNYHPPDPMKLGWHPHD